MRRNRLKKKNYVIDKSMLPYGIKRRLEDEEYLKSYDGTTCVASDNGVDECGLPAVGCHIRAYENGISCGTGEKPDDNLTEALCQRHHTEQGNDEKWFWIQKVYKPQRRRAYREWKRCQIE